MRKILTIIVFLFLGLWGCQGQIKAQISGFAVYDKVEGEFLFKAISPEGVKVQVSEKDNYPNTANLDFWQKAIEKYIPQKGYRLIKRGKTDRGRYFVFLVPGVKLDYFYFIHYEIKKEKIRLTEAGGRYAFLKMYQDSIIKFSKTDWKEK